MYTIKIKRVYEEPEVEDGYRMLVDRLWPRGVKKEVAFVDEWNKAVSPSTELRKWFDHKPEKFQRFAKLYREELADKQEELLRIKAIGNEKNLTLLYAAKDKNINHATILLSTISNLKQPNHG